MSENEPAPVPDPGAPTPATTQASRPGPDLVAPDAAAPVASAHRRRPRPTLRSLLTDGLGEVGIRSGQILLALTLIAVFVWGLVQLKLVVIPVLVALILAAALSPVIGWMRRRGLPAIVATWIGPDPGPGQDFKKAVLGG